jgi:hypothetical protein
LDYNTKEQYEKARIAGINLAVGYVPGSMTGSAGYPHNPFADSPSKPADVAPVMQALEVGEKLEAVLRQELEQLEDRISPVLRPAPPSAAEGGTSGPGFGSTVSQLLERRNAGLSRAIDAVRALRLRVDL